MAEHIKSKIACEQELGSPVPYSYPTCGGPLWAWHHDGLHQYRDHVGHALTPRALIADQDEAHPGLSSWNGETCRMVAKVIELSRHLCRFYLGYTARRTRRGGLSYPVEPAALLEYGMIERDVRHWVLCLW